MCVIINLILLMMIQIRINNFTQDLFTMIIRVFTLIGNFVHIFTALKHIATHNE